jgi:hypothetical protein
MDDQRVMVVGYKRIWEYKENALTELIAQSQLSNGIRFYDAVFNSYDDYWLYATQGNVLHYLNGAWKNYRPPPDMNTGNFGECMIKTQSGEIWMSLSRFPDLLRFDGQKWHKVNTNHIRPARQVTDIVLTRQGKLVARESQTRYPLEFVGSEFQPLAELPQVDMNDIKTNEAGDYYWRTKDGIYKKPPASSAQTLVSFENGGSDFGVIGDEVWFGRNDRLCIFKNGVVEEIPNDNRHFLGYENLYPGALRFNTVFDGTMFITLSGRGGQITTYDGHNWGKIIEIEGKLIGAISEILTSDTLTYIVTAAGSVARYDANGLRWIHYDNSSKKNVNKAVISQDGRVGFIYDKKTLKMYDTTGELVSLEIPLDNIAYSLQGLVYISDNVYDLYFHKTTFRMYLE